jgi:hypothetical protein
MHTKLLGITGVGFDTTDQLLTDQIFCICQKIMGGGGGGGNKKKKRFKYK